MIDKKQDLEILRDRLLQQLEDSIEVIQDELKRNEEEPKELNKMHAVVHLIEIIEYIIDRKYPF